MTNNTDSQMNEPNQAETPEKQIIELNNSRDIDLMIGLIPITDSDGRVIKRPAFGAVFLSSSFFRAVCENLEDIKDNGFKIIIKRDPKKFEEALAEKANIVQVSDYRAPTYQVRVETIEQAPVHFYSEDLVPLTKDTKPVEVDASKDEEVDEIEEAKLEMGRMLPAKRMMVPVYHFMKDGFDGSYVQRFQEAMLAQGGWLLVLQDGNTKEQAVWWNTAASISNLEAGWGSRNPENRQGRRRRRKDD